MLTHDQISPICDAFHRGKLECIKEIRINTSFGLIEARRLVESVSSVQQLRGILEEFARGTRRHFSNAIIDLTIKLEASREEVEAAFRQAMYDIYGSEEPNEREA